MRQTVVLRLYATGLAAALLWALLGAPLLPAEWHDVPHRISVMFTQLLPRARQVLSHWL